MKSLRKELFTIVLLLVFALVGTYVVNAGSAPQQPVAHESVSVNATTEFLPIVWESAEIETQGVDGTFLLATDYGIKCTDCSAMCTGMTGGDDPFYENCMTWCRNNCVPND